MLTLRKCCIIEFRLLGDTSLNYYNLFVFLAFQPLKKTLKVMLANIAISIVLIIVSCGTENVKSRAL